MGFGNRGHELLVEGHDEAARLRATTSAEDQAFEIGGEADEVELLHAALPVAATRRSGPLFGDGSTGLLKIRASPSLARSPCAPAVTQ